MMLECFNLEIQSNLNLGQIDDYIDIKMKVFKPGNVFLIIKKCHEGARGSWV